MNVNPVSSESFTLPECGICFATYSENCIPTVIAPCGHTFCEQCLNNVTKCPSDRSVIISKRPNFAFNDWLPEFIKAQQFIKQRDSIIDQVKIESQRAAMLCKEMEATVKKQGAIINQATIESQRTIALFEKIDDESNSPAERSKARYELVLFYLEMDGNLPRSEVKARSLLERVAKDPSDPVCQVQARFKLAQFYKNGLGGLPQSNEQERLILEQIQDDPNLSVRQRASICTALIPICAERHPSYKRSLLLNLVLEDCERKIEEKRRADLPETKAEIRIKSGQLYDEIISDSELGKKAISLTDQFLKIANKMLYEEQVDKYYNDTKDLIVVRAIKKEILDEFGLPAEDFIDVVKKVRVWNFKCLEQAGIL